MNNSLPFNKYAFLTTHNSFAIDNGKLKLTLTNQEDTISQQLNNGVRGLMLDTYVFEGEVWLCHSFGGKCHYNTKFYWFPLSRMPKGGQDWPLVSDMVAQNQRLLVFTSEESKETSEGIAYQWNYMVENQYGDDGMEAGKCSNRKESNVLNDMSRSLVLVNYFPKIPIKLVACVQHSDNLDDMLRTCSVAAGNRFRLYLSMMIILLKAEGTKKDSNSLSFHELM
ncbi:PLC-like phosphodiesterases superfamily protein [Striga asiatica]|uniref:PLC-like phosphodiesterases superfamily protein n=1 Tax=Striga asiatica TaxID=4170 RepID=A0A5A7QR05_STRAF|nr:PLC-like phosphodiesterases superfamily protein [Striga asiatica]